MLRFLDVEPDTRDLFPRVNENKGFILPWIGRGLRHPPSGFVAVNRMLRRYSGISVGNWLRRRLTAVKHRPELSADLRAKLQMEFRDDVKDLAALTQRDLSAWLDGAAVSS